MQENGAHQKTESVTQTFCRVISALKSSVTTFRFTFHSQTCRNTWVQKYVYLQDVMINEEKGKAGWVLLGAEEREAGKRMGWRGTRRGR